MTTTSCIPRPLGVATGVLLDRLFAEPAAALHPVVHFGRLMTTFERRNYSDSRQSGVVHTLAGLLLGLGAGNVIRSTSVATGLACGGRALERAASDVNDALQHGDLDRARELLPSLVGRDPSGLDATEIVRATVESVAENTVDAVIAPMLWAVVAGAGGALGYRAINTMDAMVGHHSPRYERYGWASARLDDVVNWLPARCTAVLVCLVRPRATNEIRRAVTSQARAHPSPNAGVAEAAFAAALGVRLGGRNHYGERVEDRPQLGSGRPVAMNDIARATRLSRDVTSALAVMLALIGLILWRRR